MSIIMHKRYLLILSLAWLAYCLLPAAHAASQVQERILDNGLKVLVKEDHRAPVVVSQIWYKVGSSYEHNGITGVSHVLEHMMFKGTEKYASGEFSRIISENGGRENAFTGSDYTAYFQTLERSKIAISFELEAHRMRALQLQAEEFAKEREVVKEERRWRTEDDPESYTYELAMATAFQAGAYRYPIIGWMDDLDNMTLASLKDWYQLWYAPNNATLVVVGDIDADEIFKLAEQYFAPLASSELSLSLPPQEPAQQGLKRITVKRPAELPYLMLLYKAPSISASVPAWETYALEVLAGILDGGNSARFAKELVRGQEVAASINLRYQPATRMDNVFMISARPASGKTIHDLEQAITSEINRLQTKFVDEKELQRVKAQVVSSHVYQQDSIFYQALELGILETVGLSWRLAEQYVEQIQAVTAEQLQTVAKKYLIDDHLTIAELLPQPLAKHTSQPPKHVNRHAY